MSDRIRCVKCTPQKVQKKSTCWLSNIVVTVARTTKFKNNKVGSGTNYPNRKLLKL